MKTAMKLIMLSLLTTIITSSYGQKINVTKGSLGPLKNEKSINLEFRYDGMSVGKFAKEEDYIAKRRTEMNTKEAGLGDKWAESWVNDRKAAYEPKFVTLFTDYSKKTISADAPYTLIFHTTFTEPGYNVGVWRGDALINAIVTIVETKNRNNIIAEISLSGSKGRMAMGSDFATSWRIAECYARAGRELAKRMK